MIDLAMATTWLGWTAIILGLAFFFSGTIGLLRFPDTLTRLHALTKADNLGLGLVVLGLLIQGPGFEASVKLIAIWLLVLLSSATGSHLVASMVDSANDGRRELR